MQYSAPSTPLLDVRPPTGTRIKTSVTSCLALAIENFQATGNVYLMRITNRNELHPWRSTGPGPVPVATAADAPAPAQADAAGPSAPQHR
jgi:hypothetical protein